MKDSEVPDKLNQMIFIYNALKNGWTVKSLGKDSFQFIKKKNTKEIDLEECQSLNSFISENI